MFIIDLHCDSIQKVDTLHYDLVNPYNYSKKYKQIQCFAMMTGGTGDSEEDAWRRACRYTGLFCMSLVNEADKVIQVKTYEDIERAFREDKYGAILTMESATGIKGSPKLLESFYNIGVRIVGLTWLSNILGKSNRVFDDGEEDTGISDIGKSIVKKGNELGIIWDVSHASDKLFWDLAELTKKPLVATHSNFRALCSHSRNLTDEMAKHIIKTGGMIGLNITPFFIHNEKDKQTVPYLFRHLDHCLALGGENNIGFGCDIDGIEEYPSPLTRESSMHDQLIELMQKHYPESLVEKIAGENYLNYLKKNLR